MSLLSLCNNTLFISILFTTVMCGIIMYLMNTKISRVEKNIQKQNQALVEAVNHIKFDVNNSMLEDSQNSVMQSHNLSDMTLNTDQSVSEKISVSDDSDVSDSENSEYDSSDSDSDSDSVSDNDKDKDNNNTNIDTTSQQPEITINEDANILKTINLSTFQDNSDTTKNHIKEITVNKNLDDDTSSSDDDDDDDDDDSSDNNSKDSNDDNNSSSNKMMNTISESELKRVLDKVPSDSEKEPDKINVLKSFSSAVSDEKSSVVRPGLTKLKVPELKQMVINKKLASPNSVSDMKKKNLIEFLRSE